MSVKKLLTAVTAALLLSALFTPAEAYGEIRISAKLDNNPTIRFAGVPGNSELTRQMRSMLNACGWFDLTESDNAAYRLNASESGGRMTFTLSMGGASIGSWTVSAANPRRSAKLAVDTLLERLFKIKGLCSSRVVFCADTAKGVKNLYVCDIDGGDVQQITNFRSLCVEPCWFPDGNSIAYTKYGKAVTDVVQTELSPRRSRRLSSFPGLNAGISVSPDKKNMALILSPDHQVDLYVKPVNGGAPRRLTRGKAVEASPCWSPDSRYICYVSDETGRPRLYRVDIRSGRRERLPSVGNEAVTPDWSGDDKIVYATRIGGVYTLAVLDLNKKENTRATMVPGTWESPSWAPDNRQVVCKRSDGSRSSLFVVDTWTGKARQLLRTSNPLSMPAWSKAVK